MSAAAGGCGPRFNLCALLLALGAACVALGVKTEQARRQRAAVAELRDLGVDCTYDYQVGNDGHLMDVGTGDLSGLAKLLGVDWAHRVLWATVGDSAEGVGANALNQLPYLEKLKIYGRSDLGDAELRQIIKHHPDLIGLCIYSCPRITLDGLGPLLELNGLKHLTSDTPDPDAVFAAKLKAKGVTVSYVGAYD